MDILVKGAGQRHKRFDVGSSEANVMFLKSPVVTLNVMTLQGSDTVTSIFACNSSNTITSLRLV